MKSKPSVSDVDLFGRPEDEDVLLGVGGDFCYDSCAALCMAGCVFGCASGGDYGSSSVEVAALATGTYGAYMNWMC